MARLLSFRPEDQNRESRELRAILPWWRRLGAWLGDFHKFVTVIVGVAATTIAVHAWLGGLITRAELNVTVRAALAEALSASAIQSDIATIKNSTNDLPAWRGEVSNRLTRVEVQAATNGEMAKSVTDRVDRYLISRGR